MKTTIIFMLIAVSIGRPLHAQTDEATQLLLNYEKLKQLEEILDNMYKGYKILTAGYNRIKDIAEGNYRLHEVFLDGLFAVNPSIAKYKRISQIIWYQKLLMREYRRAFSQFRNDENLTRDEIAYLEKVYSYLAQHSLHNIEELTMIVTANKLRMSDDERLQAIDRIYLDVENKLSFLRYFNSSTQILVVQRAKENNEFGAVKKLYEIE